MSSSQPQSAFDSLVARFADVRADERRVVWASFATLLGVSAGHALLETARDALFLARLPVKELAWVYLAVAAVGLLLAQVERRALGRLRSSAGVAVVLGACALITGVFWSVLGSRDTWSLYAFYLWSAICASWVVLQFFLVLGRMFTVTQAKRLFGIIGAGSVLGALLGSALAQGLTRVFEARHLVLVATGLFIVTAVGPCLMVSRGMPVEQQSASARVRRTFAGDMRLLATSPYLRRLLTLTLLGTLALGFGDFVFKSEVKEHIAPENLGSFFATLYTALNLVALLVQLFGVGWLMRTAGVQRALLVLPALYVLGAGAIALTGTLAAALALKASDGTLRHSLQRTTHELLYVPVPDGMRERAKPFIDLIGQRGGQALAALLILGSSAWGTDVAYVLGWILAALALAWLLASSKLRRPYLDLFRQTLRAGRLRGAVDLPKLDLEALETLVGALNSERDGEVIQSLDLLAEHGRGKLVPGLILYHPSRDVVLHAMDIFEQNDRIDVVPVLDRLSSHDDFDIRSTAVRVRARLKPDREQLLKCRAAHECKGTRATALVALVGRDWIPIDEAERELAEYAADDNPAIRLTVAAAIRRQPTPALSGFLVRMADSTDGAVLSELALAMGAIADRRFVEPLIRMLGNRTARESARTALVAIGAPALDELADALADYNRPHELRRHIPRTISRFEPDEAAPLLVRHLLDDPDGMVRYKVLRGLCNLHADSPGVHIDRDILDKAIARTVGEAFRMLDSLASLELGATERPDRATAAHTLLVDLLRSKQSHAVDRLFRLLRLRHPREAFRDIHRGLGSPNAKTRSSALELVENVLSGELRTSVLALVDDGDVVERLARATPFFTPERLGYDETVRAIFSRGRGTLHLVAEHQAREIGLALSLAPPAAVAVPAPATATETIRRAVDALLGPGDPEPIPT